MLPQNRFARYGFAIPHSSLKSRSSLSSDKLLRSLPSLSIRFQHIFHTFYLFSWGAVANAHYYSTNVKKIYPAVKKSRNGFLIRSIHCRRKISTDSDSLYTSPKTIERIIVRLLESELSIVCKGQLFTSHSTLSG